jgi:hypothetical protein
VEIVNCVVALAAALLLVLRVVARIDYDLLHIDRLISFDPSPPINDNEYASSPNI